MQLLRRNVRPSVGDMRVSIQIDTSTAEWSGRMGVRRWILRWVVGEAKCAGGFGAAGSNVYDAIARMNGGAADDTSLCIGAGG